MATTEFDGVAVCGQLAAVGNLHQRFVASSTHLRAGFSVNRRYKPTGMLCAFAHSIPRMQRSAHGAAFDPVRELADSARSNRRILPLKELTMQILTDRTENTHRSRLPDTAAVLMTRNPVSLDHRISVPEAAAALVRREIGAAPVINEAGRAIGVISQSDIVRHAVKNPRILGPSQGDLRSQDDPLEPGMRATLTVAEIMTPTVYCVRPDTPVNDIIGEFLAHDVHRLFVADEDEVLIGVITSLDILRVLSQ